MIICSYIGRNFSDCMKLTLPTWKADKILIYSDTDDFGIKMFEPSEDPIESWHRKILIIQRTLKENPNENVLYLDGDVLMKGDVSEVFKNPADVIATRMVIRPDRPYYKEVNAGVSFWKSNERTLKFCEEWLKLEAELRKDPTIPYAEQRAFNTLIYKGYDGLAEWTCSNVSENVFNFERDDDKQFVNHYKEYNPKLIHLKQGKWKNQFILDFISKSNII
jgi:lipopolysaccharide biosynthesis glycosyltransferase